MPTANPLEQLRRRMQSHATPAAFAALAEEHRRAGRFADAIAVCRDGLAAYPTYVSARVTLGRALLDSGEIVAALDELTQAVAQAPDNLAATRALDAAQAARAAMPEPPPLAPTSTESSEAAGAEPTPAAFVAQSSDLPPLPDVSPLLATDALEAFAPEELPLRAADVAEADGDSRLGEVLHFGADGPQEFGLSPDWSLPETPSAGTAVAAPPSMPDADDGVTGDLGHADAQTMMFTPPHLQGEEPAGIWPVPDEAAAQSDGAAVFSWAIDPPSGEARADHSDLVATDPAARSIWDAPTIEAPLVDVVALSSAPAADSDDHAGPDAALSDDSSAFWTGRFGGEPEPETPPPFAAWHTESQASAAPASDGAGETDGPSWAFEASSAEVPTDGPSAAWVLAGETAQDPPPFQDVPEAEAPVSPFGRLEALAIDAAPPLSAAGAASGIASTLDAAREPEQGAQAEIPPTPPEGRSAWEGSLASALGEVFARAGQVESLEPPTHPSAAVRAAMADAAVEATIEDVADREDVPPALIALEQMLASVRARRAALFSNLH